MNSPAHDDERFDKAKVSLEETITKLRGCTEAEKNRLNQELLNLTQMYEKLATGRLEIVVFGEISTGKSALINAIVGKEVTSVDVQGGWTKEIKQAEWATSQYSVPGFAESQILMVDTPGINEVQGQERADLAKEAARRADLILFVTDSDLNDVEHAALLQLLSLNKPLILVLNKKDLYSPDQRKRLREVLEKERTIGLLRGENIVMTSADPREVEYVIEDAQGNTRNEWKKPKPDIAELKDRILTIFESDGLALIALNAAIYAADTSDRISSVRVEMRNRHANKVIWSYAAIKAITVAHTPAIVDIVGGAAVDISMVAVLSRIYGLEMSWSHAKDLVIAIGKAAGWTAAGVMISQVGMSVVKSMTFGLATAITAIPQGAGAGFASYIVGQSAKYYFEHGASWGGESPKAVVQQILASTDRTSVIGQLKDQIKDKLHINPHAKTTK